MKIRASQIKPGMVLGINRGDKFGDVCLILAVRKGCDGIEYTHLDYHDAYGGALVGNIARKEKVKVVNGKKRAQVITKIKGDLFKNLHDLENLVDMVRLIEAMETKPS